MATRSRSIRVEHTAVEARHPIFLAAKSSAVCTRHPLERVGNQDEREECPPAFQTDLQSSISSGPGSSLQQVNRAGRECSREGELPRKRVDRIEGGREKRTVAARCAARSDLSGNDRMARASSGLLPVEECHFTQLERTPCISLQSCFNPRLFTWPGEECE